MSPRDRERALREWKGQTAAALKKAGMDGARAEQVAQRYVQHAEDKAAGREVNPHAQPITDTRKK